MEWVIPDPATSLAPWRLYNIGNSNPVELMDYISAIEKAIGKEAKKNYLQMQPGDVPATSSNVQALMDDFLFKPDTLVEEGVKRFVDWYRAYYKT